MTSPSTNLEIMDPTLAMLVPSVGLRGQVLAYRERKTREWEELGGQQ